MKKKIDTKKADAGDHRDSQLQLVKREFSRANDYSSEYNQGDTPTAHFFNTRLKRVSELLGDFNSGRLLDVGCGPAIIGNTFRGGPVEYYGIDISEDMIKECRNAYGNDPQFNFSAGRIEDLPFPDSYFDVVLCLGAFEYVLDDHVAMSEIARVVKPGGIAIITMLNGKSPYRAWQDHAYWKFRNRLSRLARLIKWAPRQESGKTGWQGGKKPKVRLYGETAFRRLLASKGLETEDVVYYDFNLFFSPLDARFPRASVSLSRKLESLGRSRLKFLGTGFILKSRKISNES